MSVAGEYFESRSFERDRIIVVQVIDADNLRADVLEQMPGRMKADKSGRSRHEDFHLPKPQGETL
jgi:hypothetical protein